jgi:hypothetical protein
MPKSSAARSKEWRVRRDAHLDVTPVETKREEIVGSGLLSAEEYDDPDTRRRLLSAYLRGQCAVRSFR